jgi:hypothetical protein
MKIFYYHILNNKCVEQTFKIDLGCLENLVVNENQIDCKEEEIHQIL